MILNKMTIYRMRNSLFGISDHDDRKLINLALFLILILSIIFLVSLYAARNRTFTTPTDALVRDDVFGGVEIEARSAIVYDIANSRSLFEKEPNLALPLASLAKVMTAVTALELLPNYTVITIHGDFLREEGDSGLLRDEKWTLRDLVDLSLVSSSNDAAAAIAATAGRDTLSDPDLNLNLKEFIKKMNEKAREIGMINTLFYNATGLDVDDTLSGAYASVNDYITLLKYALDRYPEIFEATRLEKVSLTSLNNENHRATNTNIGIGSIPNVIGSKTGYTEIAGGNLAVIFDPSLGRPFVIVVLGSSYDGRFSDVEKLTEKTLLTLTLE